MNDNILPQQTKTQLIEYSNNTDIHAVLGVTFNDILIAVWNRIILHEHKDEIKKVLIGLMNDSVNKCFTGRISRLISCLCIFDKDVVINISENEQIGNVIIQIENNLRKLGKYTIDEHKKLVTEQLKELEIDNKIIDEWISEIK